jgi:predicted esterase
MASFTAGEVQQGLLNPANIPTPTGQSPKEPRKDALGKFPSPMIIPPRLDHRQTIIILHGRGSSASKFGPPLLETTVSGQTIQTIFPHAKIIFPTACKEKATIYKNPTHQWFDNWHLEEHTKRQYLMVEGLNRSCGFVHGILREEIETVGRENVVLWGLSQGCATALMGLLAWDGEVFAGVVGMCGWLPYSNDLIRVVGGDEDGEDDLFGFSGDEDEDPFARSDDEDGREGSAKGDLPSQAVAFLRESIEMENKKGMVFQKIPVFLGHGTEDDRVVIELGREAKNALELIGMDVRMNEYEGLGHWYSEDMLRDIFRFIKEKLKI